MPGQFISVAVPKVFFALLLSALVLGCPTLVWADKLLPSSDHYLFVDKEGKLWGWGDNTFGQLGREGVPTARLPLDIAVPISSAAAGKRHSVAVDVRGSVWVWGDNSAGQLGTGDFKGAMKPLRLELPAAVAVAAGVWHTVALDKSGHVWAWGGNTLGQLGSGKSGRFSVSTTPQKVIGLDNVVAIRSGDYHVLALRTDGSVWAWGKYPNAAEAWKVPHLIEGALPDELVAAFNIRSNSAFAKPSLDQDIHGRANAVKHKLELALELKANQEHAIPAAAVSIPSDSSEQIREKEAVRMQPTALPELRAKAATEEVPAPKKEEAQAISIHIGGTVHMSGMGAKGEAVSAVEIVGKGAQCGQTDVHGDYLCSVPVGWSGHLTAAKHSYRFSPRDLFSGCA